MSDRSVATFNLNFPPLVDVELHETSSHGGFEFHLNYQFTTNTPAAGKTQTKRSRLISEAQLGLVLRLIDAHRAPQKP